MGEGCAPQILIIVGARVADLRAVDAGVGESPPALPQGNMGLRGVIHSQDHFSGLVRFPADMHFNLKVIGIYLVMCIVLNYQFSHLFIHLVFNHKC